MCKHSFQCCSAWSWPKLFFSHAHWLIQYWGLCAVHIVSVFNGNPLLKNPSSDQLTMLFSFPKAAWMTKIGGKSGNNVYSQGGEDGIIEAIFDQIGTTDKVYVEFGVEDCTQCNSRYLRQKGWDVNNSLLMDGGHSKPEINLKKVVFFPHNIVCLFGAFGVKKKFDFLSVDTDNNDFFMLEAILAGGYRPRLIAIEINAREILCF